MKVELTPAARADLDDILAYTRSHFPFQLEALEQRFQIAFARIRENPEGARCVEQRRDVRVLPLIRFPFKVFYRVGVESVEVLRIYHVARAEPEL